MIRNVTMIGTGNYGIETYAAASTTEPIIDLIENVKIDSMKYGIDLRFSLGTIKDSIISGSLSGIATQNSGITMNFEGNNEIRGGQNAILVQNGSVSITADKYTSFVNSSGGDIVFNVPSACAASSSFNIVGYTVSGNTFTECEHESTGGSCTVRAECTKCTKALGYVHNYVEKVDERIPSDCTVQGTAFMYCDCGAETTEFVPRNPNAHVWQETTTPATCTADGGTTYNCKYGSCVGEEYTNPIPALGHDIIIDIKGTPATCTQPGMTNAEHCSRCNDVTVTATAIPALGHTWVDATEDAPKTCTTCALTEGEKVPSGLGTGAIVGIAVGGVAVLGGGGFCLWWFVFRKKFI